MPNRQRSLKASLTAFSPATNSLSLVPIKVLKLLLLTFKLPFTRAKQQSLAWAVLIYISPRSISTQL